VALAGYARTHDSLQRPDSWIVAQQTLAIELGTTGRTAGAASTAEATSAAECTATSRPIRDRSTCRLHFCNRQAKDRGLEGLSVLVPRDRCNAAHREVLKVPLPALCRCGRTRGLRPAPRICGSPGLSDNCLWRVPWFHENALLQVDGGDDDLADDGAGCAAGEC
jgi:hypothetical protein